MECVYRHIRHLTAPEEPLASFFGRVVHAGVRAFYEAGADEAAQAALIYWAEEIGSGRVVLAAASSSKPDYRTPELAAALVRVYAAAYATPASRGYDVVMNERYLELGGNNGGNKRRHAGNTAHDESGNQSLEAAVSQFDNRGDGGNSLATDSRNDERAIECGIVDRVVRRHADGLLYVLDLKTSAWAPTAGYWQQWSNSQQAALYLDLVEAALGEAPAGFWCDHIYVSGRKAGPEPDDLMQFGPVAYSAAKRAELRQQRAAWREQFALLQARPERAVQSTRSCFRFASACPYLAYCSADPADREAMVQRDLQVGTLVERPWDPASRDHD